MIKPLFNKVRRTHKGPAKYSEPKFNYLDKSERKHLIKARSILNRWFLEYAKSYGKKATEEFRQRFCTENNREHLSTLTELYIHNFINEHGYNIKLHPKIKEKNKRPDYLAYKNNKKLFYLEVMTLISPEKTELVEKFENTILDSIDEKISSPGFLISVDFIKSNKQNPPFRKIIDNLQKWISNLSYADICKKMKIKNKPPGWIWERQEWKIRFEAIPVKQAAKKKRCGSKCRNIASISHSAKNIWLDRRIQKAVERKLYKYGKAKLPFILTINVIDEGMFCDDETILSALLGNLAIKFSILPNGKRQSVTTRTGDGIWVHPQKGVKWTRCSGLIVLKELSHHNLVSVDKKLWVNPKAKHPFNEKLLKVPKVTFDLKKNKINGLDKN